MKLLPDPRMIARQTFLAEERKNAEFQDLVFKLEPVVAELLTTRIEAAAAAGEWGVVVECPPGVDLAAFRLAAKRVSPGGYVFADNAPAGAIRLSWYAQRNALVEP